MTGRTRFGPNVVDTEQLYDACVTAAKIDPTIASGVTTAIATALAAAKTADKTVVKYAQCNCAATGTVVYPICTVPSISVVTRVITVAEVGIVGNGTQTVGDAGDAAGFLADGNITKTLNAISGEDPATYGAYLWVPGATATPAQNGTTPFAVTAWPTPTTWGHYKPKVYLTDTVINLTSVKGTNSVGTLGVYVFYDKLVAST